MSPPHVHVRSCDAPTVLEALSDVASLALVDDTSCALDTRGAVRCWGTNEHGVLGALDAEQSDVPVLVEGLPPAREIVVGDDFGCARDDEETVRCWGAATGPDRADRARSTELPALHDARGLVGFGTSVCGVTNERVVSAQRPAPPARPGRRSPRRRSWPHLPGAPTLAADELATTPPARALVVGRDHACVAAADGAVWCWGYNGDAAVGDVWAEARSRPGQVLGAQDDTSVDRERQALRGRRARDVRRPPIDVVHLVAEDVRDAQPRVGHLRQRVASRRRTERVRLDHPLEVADRRLVVAVFLGHVGESAASAPGAPRAAKRIVPTSACLMSRIDPD